MAARQSYKNRVVITFFDETGSRKIWNVAMYLPSADESGMLAYLLRRSLTHRNFIVSQDRWTGIGFVPLDSTTLPMTHSVKEAFDDLAKARYEKSASRMILRLINDEGVESPFDLVLYSPTLSSADILHTLLVEGSSSLKKELISEAKNRDSGEWETRVPKVFIRKDWALLFTRLSETNKVKAAEHLQKLLTSEEH